MSNPLSYYIGLITSEHSNKPKFVQYVSMLIQPLIDTQNFCDNIEVAFDVDNAAGVQQDILGEIVGVSRTLNFTPSNGNPVLNDLDYQVLLKAKIAQNNWDGKIGSLQTIWGNLFPGGSIMILDNFDMSISVALSGSFSLVIRDCVRNGLVVPKPEGVRLNYTLGDLPFFGFDMETLFVAGFDRGSWSYVAEPIHFGFDLENSTISGFDVGFWSN